MDPIINFLKEGKLPDETSESQTVKPQALKYTLHDGELLHRSITKIDVHPYLKYLQPSKVHYVLRKIH